MINAKCPIVVLLRNNFIVGRGLDPAARKHIAINGGAKTPPYNSVFVIAKAVKPPVAIPQ